MTGSIASLVLFLAVVHLFAEFRGPRSGDRTKMAHTLPFKALANGGLLFFLAFTIQYWFDLYSEGGLTGIAMIALADAFFLLLFLESTSYFILAPTGIEQFKPWRSRREVKWAAIDKVRNPQSGWILVRAGTIRFRIPTIMAGQADLKDYCTEHLHPEVYANSFNHLSPEER